MYVLPSRDMIVVRLGETEDRYGAGVYQDAVFLSLLLTGDTAEVLPQVQAAGRPRRGR